MTGRPIAVLWRGTEDARRAGLASNERLRPVVDALSHLGADVKPIVYRDAVATDVAQELSGVEGVLVWVDPIGGGEDRTKLDPLLREAARRGVCVSAHPDTVAKIGTKEVLFSTRSLGWGSEVFKYTSAAELREAFPSRLRTDGVRVLKRHRGNGGIGVWRVESLANGRVAVHQADVRDLVTEHLDLHEFMARCNTYFNDAGCVIDQPFQRRVAEGLTRAYLVVNEVVGFGQQRAEAIVSTPDEATQVMGLPSPKTMFASDEETFAALRRAVETDWVPAMQSLLDIATDDLPLLWDADFLLGPKTSTGEDTYVLCEINASCITPFPPETPAVLARATMGRLTART